MIFNFLLKEGYFSGLRPVWWTLDPREKVLFSVLPYFPSKWVKGGSPQKFVEQGDLIVVMLLDGQPTDQLFLDASDPFWTVGLGIFESLTFRDGTLIAADRHLARMRNGAQMLGLTWSESWKKELDLLVDMLTGNQSVRMTLTAGGRRVLRATPWKPSLSAKLWRHPLIPLGLPASVKHTQRGAWFLAEQRLGGELLLEENGFWLETSKANLWVVRDGVLLTPPADGRILPGVTRDLLLLAAQDAGIPVRESPIQAGPFEELYLSSSFRDLCPVLSLDGTSIPGSGPVGARLQQAFSELLRLRRW